MCVCPMQNTIEYIQYTMQFCHIGHIEYAILKDNNCLCSAPIKYNQFFISCLFYFNLYTQTHTWLFNCTYQIHIVNALDAFRQKLLINGNPNIAQSMKKPSSMWDDLFNILNTDSKPWWLGMINGQNHNQKKSNTKLAKQIKSKV